MHHLSPAIFADKLATADQGLLQDALAIAVQHRYILHFPLCYFIMTNQCH